MMVLFLGICEGPKAQAIVRLSRWRPSGPDMFLGQKYTPRGDSLSVVVRFRKQCVSSGSGLTAL